MRPYFEFETDDDISIAIGICYTRFVTKKVAFAVLLWKYRLEIGLRLERGEGI